MGLVEFPLSPFFQSAEYQRNALAAIIKVGYVTHGCAEMFCRERYNITATPSWQKKSGRKSTLCFLVRFSLVAEAGLEHATSRL